MQDAAAQLATFPRDLASYPSTAGHPLFDVLWGRLRDEPFNGIATAVFVLAVFHTFLASWFTRLSHRVRHRHDEDARRRGVEPFPSVAAELLHFLGEVEVVFGLWAVVLLSAMALWFDVPTARQYVNGTVVFTEALFVVVIMNRGFESGENDQGILGEAFLTPNALTSADGRSFFDRAFVIKISGAYRAPGDVHVGMVARYQDGQPFSRLVLADGLFQGRDLVMAIPRGAQRFTYTFTLDARVEKDFTFGRRRVGLLLELFNLTDATIETEEYVVTGPTFRSVSAVQPPRAVRVGVRVAF